MNPATFLFTVFLIIRQPKIAYDVNKPADGMYISTSQPSLHVVECDCTWDINSGPVEDRGEGRDQGAAFFVALLSFLRIRFDSQ